MAQPIVSTRVAGVQGYAQSVSKTHQSVATVAEPIFSVRHRKGVGRLDLFEVFAAISSGDLVDFPAMAAHQRPAVVTAFAILMHLLRRYDTIEESNASSWAAAWDRHVGTDALRLAAPHGETAFLQPPTVEPTSQQSIQSADLLLPKVEHEVKQTWNTTAERALFAIMGSIMRPNVKDHRSATRVGLTVVLPSVDGTIGNEITQLARSYDALFSPGPSNQRLEDHLVWGMPYRPKDSPLSLADLPLPFLDVGRAQRLRAVGGDLYEIWAVPNNTIRIQANDPWLDDPHVPKLVTNREVKRYKLAAKPFDYRFEHAVLFGSRRKDEEIIRPRILDLTEYKMVRLCALGSEQGKTKGYREATFIAARGSDLFTLDEPSEEDRPARLSARALETIDAGQKVLRSALIQLFKEANDPSDVDWARINGVGDTFRTLVGLPSVQFVFDRLEDEEDITAEQKQLDQFVADGVIDAFDVAVTVFANPLQVARAEDRLRAGVRFDLGGAAMSDRDAIPLLGRQTFAILNEIMAHLSPDERARLRTMSLSDPPLSFWKLMARVPEFQAENDRCLAVWKVVFRAMGRVTQSRVPLGRVLKETDFPEDRLSRLLVASGTSLPGLLDEVARWLISHDVERADLTNLCVIGLGDALGDFEARNWARRLLALQFVRSRSGDRIASGTLQAAAAGGA